MGGVLVTMSQTVILKRDAHGARPGIFRNSNEGVIPQHFWLTSYISFLATIVNSDLENVPQFEKSDCDNDTNSDWLSDLG